MIYYHLKYSLCSKVRLIVQNTVDPGISQGWGATLTVKIQIWLWGWPLLSRPRGFSQMWAVCIFTLPGKIYLETDSHSSNTLCSRLCCVYLPGSVQLLSRVWLFVTPWTAAHQASLSIIKAQSLLKLMSTKSVMPSNHLTLCRPLLLLLSIFPSIRVFSNESVLHIRRPKYWSFSFSISPSNEYSGLIFFRMNWFHLLAVQGTLKSLLQHHISKASLLQVLAFFMVQLSLSYMTTGKTIALTRQTFVDQIMSLLFNMLSRLVIAFLPMSKCLLISWLQLPPEVILEPQK